MDKTLIELLSSTVALKFKAHGYHWNVKGANFHQFHEIFSEIYLDYEEAIDALAEWLLKLDYMAPSDLLSFYNASSVSESISTTYGIAMAEDLLMSNDDIARRFRRGVDEATSMGEHALANFFAERLDAHQRWHWQLKATIS